MSAMVLVDGEEYLTGDEAAAQKHRQENDWSVIEDAGRGWRRVVASPTPVQIVEQEAILALVNAGFVVIGVGGGGIPVIKDQQGNLVGVEAVIDKDLASALLASSINADLFLISTEVEKVALNFNSNDRGDDMIIINGEAQLAPDAPSAHQHPAYLEKYRASIARIGMAAPEAFAQSYSVAIRVTPAQVRGF